MQIILMVFIIISVLVLDFGNHDEGFGVDGLFLLFCIAGCKACKVYILQHLHDTLLLFGRHLLVGEAGTDGVAVELGEGDVVFVGQTTPDGFVNFLIESVGIARTKVFSGMLESAACQTGGTFEPETCHIKLVGLVFAPPEPRGKGSEDDGGEGEEEGERCVVLVIEGV